MVTDAQKTGENVILGGLFVQIVFFGFFLFSAMLFQRRVTRDPTPASVDASIPWKKHLYALYSSSILILIRSIFRVVEYIQGWDGYLLSKEVYIYVFDGLLMFAMMVIFVIIHPSEVNCLLGRGRVMTAKGGLKVCEAPIGV